MKSDTIPNREIDFVNLDVLREHEQIDSTHLSYLFEAIKKNNYVEPILVDEESMVILDGHHRFHIFRELGIKEIPVLFVDYNDPSIKVASRRPSIYVTKKEVIQRGLNGNLYPPKTSKHEIPNGKMQIELTKVIK